MPWNLPAGNFDGYEWARKIKAASLHRLNAVIGGDAPLAEPYNIGSAAFWITIQEDVDSIIGSAIKPSALSAPPEYDGSGNVIGYAYTTETIRSGLAQALDGSGNPVNAPFTWNRERYRAFRTLIDTTDVEGNTVADDMRAVRIMSPTHPTYGVPMALEDTAHDFPSDPNADGWEYVADGPEDWSYYSGLWYRYDVAAGRWVWDQAGGPPDVLASYNARPNWVAGGRAQKYDLLGRTVYNELYTVLDRIRWVAGPVGDLWKYRSRTGDAPTSSTYATAAAAQADSDASWTAATIDANPAIWSVEGYTITSNSGTWYGASIFNEWIAGLTTTVGPVARNVEVWTVANIGESWGTPSAFDGLGHGIANDVWQHHAAFDVPGASQSPAAEIILGDFPNAGTKPTPYPPEAANNSAIYSYRVKALLVVHKLDVPGGSPYFS